MILIGSMLVHHNLDQAIPMDEWMNKRKNECTHAQSNAKVLHNKALRIHVIIDVSLYWEKNWKHADAKPALFE